MAEDLKRPAHYTRGDIEPMDFIIAQDLPWCAGNVVKYVTRFRWKGTPLKDLEKARVYLDRLIAEELKRAAKESCNVP